eukprot:15460243-Alexandrium_andersonii.AAC.1
MQWVVTRAAPTRGEEGGRGASAAAKEAAAESADNVAPKALRGRCRPQPHGGKPLRAQGNARRESAPSPVAWLEAVAATPGAD